MKKTQKVGIDWPPPVDEEYLTSEAFVRQQTVEGLTADEHSYWRGEREPIARGRGREGGRERETECERESARARERVNASERARERERERD